MCVKINTSFYFLFLFLFPVRWANTRGDIQRMLLAADQKRVRHVPLENVLALEKVCKEAGGLQGELQGGLGFIYPGTKWCGPGNSERQLQSGCAATVVLPKQPPGKCHVARQLVGSWWLLSMVDHHNICRPRMPVDHFHKSI